MVRAIALLCLAVLGPVAPAQALEVAEARHLLARTGFGAPRWAEIRALLPLDYEAAVERLLDAAGRPPVTPPPAWVDDPPPTPAARRGPSPAEREAFRRRLREQGHELKTWWVAEMMATPSPLTERLVLFWHNHFTSSLRKVRWPPALYRQQMLFRRHALGDFAALLRAVAKDPAMLVYLDGRTNRVGEPNENFARELFELFALGEGRGYGEADIREAARAFTGWTVDPRTAGFVVRPRAHDSGEKTVLGRTGRFDGDDVIDVLLDEPRLAEHVTERLWRAFVSDAPDADQVRRLAAAFRDGGYELRPLVKGLLMTDAFRDPANRGTMIKSPVDVTVGTLRLMQVTTVEPQRLVRLQRALGQDLFDPPNVKGWPGGEAWITTSSLPLRESLLQRLARGAEMAGSAMAGPSRPIEAAPPEAVARVMLAVAPVEPPPPDVSGFALLAHLLLDPAFQVK